MVSSGMCLVTHCYVRDMTQLAAKDEITGALLRYTRGIDRLDGDLVLSAFHPGAMCVDYGAEPMRIEDFVTYAIPKLGDAYSATQHRVSNVAIEFDEGNRSAICEAYVLAFHVKQTDAAPKLHTFNGRYIDRFERRSDVWKIATRTLRVEWSRIETLDETMGGAWVESGRDRSDVVYQRP
jgi:hypothetical protein